VDIHQPVQSVEGEPLDGAAQRHTGTVETQGRLPVFGRESITVAPGAKVLFLMILPS
jgi:hypothetical protein